MQQSEMNTTNYSKIQLQQFSERLRDQLREAGNRPRHIKKAWKCYAIGDGCKDEMPTPSLLAAEKAYAVKHDQWPEHHLGGTTLVVLVGRSFHPIMQAVEGFQPDRLVVVLNKAYGDVPDDPEDATYRSGKDQWDILEPCLNFLPARQEESVRNATTPIFLDKPEEEEKPTKVFELLRDVLYGDLLQEGRRVIVDVTTAKKSMMSGAFMLAAQTDATINYIDTDEFSNGVPYGYACHFRTLDNPQKVLNIRLWQNIQHNYLQYDFSRARAFLTTLSSGNSKDNKWFDKFLQIHELWESGHYFEAWQASDKLEQCTLKAEHPFQAKKQLPNGIIELGKIWTPRTAKKIDPTFFYSGHAVSLYALDEFQRIKRLTTESNFRAAFTRAFALHETLIKSRLLRAVKSGEIVVTLNDGATDWETVETFCLKLGWQDSLHALRGKKGPGRGGRADGINASYEFAFFPVSLELIQLRNSVAHTYFPISLEVTQAVIDLARANYQEYQQNWMTKVERDFTHRATLLPWEEVCEQFTLTMIPTQNR